MKDLYSHKIIKSKSQLKRIKAACDYYSQMVTTNGCFDLLHYGHIHSLQQATQFGTLVVLVNSDKSIKKLKGSKRPIQPLDIRMKQLAALSCVDYIYPFDSTTPNEVLELIKPSLHIKSNQYKKEELAEYETCVKNNIDIKLVSMYPGISTTKLIKKIRQ